MSAQAPAVRQSVVRRLLASADVRSQAELVDRLRGLGFEASQGTVSRDLAALGARKSRRGAGSVYVLPDPTSASSFTAPGGEPGDLASLGASLVLEAAHGSHVVVLHCPVGAAGFVAASIDRAHVPGVLGTLAGDDTVLIVTSDADAAARLQGSLGAGPGH